MFPGVVTSDLVARENIEELRARVKSVSDSMRTYEYNRERKIKQEINDGLQRLELDQFVCEGAFAIVPVPDDVSMVTPTLPPVCFLARNRFSKLEKELPSFMELMVAAINFDSKNFERFMYHHEIMMRKVRFAAPQIVPSRYLLNYTSLTFGELFDKNAVQCNWIGRVNETKFDFTVPLTSVQGEDHVFPEYQHATLNECRMFNAQYPGCESGYCMESLCGRKIAVVTQQKLSVKEGTPQEFQEIQDSWNSTVNALGKQGWSDRNIIFIITTNRSSQKYTKPVEGNVYLLDQELLSAYLGPCISNVMRMNAYIRMILAT